MNFVDLKRLFETKDKYLSVCKMNELSNFAAKVYYHLLNNFAIKNY